MGEPVNRTWNEAVPEETGSRPVPPASETPWQSRVHIL